MSQDIKIRDLERRGDPESMRALLHERFRAGQPFWRCDGSKGEYNCAGGDLAPGIVYGVESNKPVRHSPCKGTGRADLPEEDRVSLLAYLGHPEALTADPASACSEFQRQALDLWIKGLNRWPSALFRAALAAGRAALPIWEHGAGWFWSGDRLREREFVMLGPDLGWSEAVRPRKALDASDAYAADPTEANRVAAVGGASELLGQPIEFWEGPALIIRQGAADNQSPSAFERCADIAGEAAVREAITKRLTAWALGLGT